MIITIFAKIMNQIKNMHFVLSYDLGAQGTRRKEIEDRIENILSPYTHVKRLSTLYIVQIRISPDWEAIRTALTALSKEIPERFHFIMSPVMSEGTYNGVLSSGEWNDINAISKS